MLKTVPQLYPWILTILYTVKKLLLYIQHIPTFFFWLLGFLRSISIHTIAIFTDFIIILLAIRIAFFLSNQSVIKIFIKYIKYNMLQIAKFKDNHGQETRSIMYFIFLLNKNFMKDDVTSMPKIALKYYI